MSCMVHTTGFPVSNIFRMSFSDNIPWLIQCKWMTSASLNSGKLVISVPLLAMSTSNKCLRLSQRCTQMTNRSHKKCHFWRHDGGNEQTVSWSVSLSRTSILAFTPLFFSASINLLAATAAPPVFSLVFTISTRIHVLWTVDKGTKLFKSKEAKR